MKARVAQLLLLFLLHPVAVTAINDTTIRVPILSPPIILYELYVWRDGGSLGFIIGDHSGIKIKFVVDYKEYSTTWGWFFLNTIHKDRGEGQQLPLGGTEEKQLLRYLSLWLESKFSKQEIDEISATKDFRNISKDQLYAFHVKRLLDNRDKVIERVKRAQQSSPAVAEPRR
jgi:hypothetical protein